MSDDDKKKGTFPRVGRTKLRCWACGKKGHNRDDLFCKKEDGVKERRRVHSKRKCKDKGNRGSNSYIRQHCQDSCQHPRKTGKCKFSETCCRFNVDTGRGQRRRPGHLARKKSFNLAKIESQMKESALGKGLHKVSPFIESEADIDSNVKGFYMLSICANPRSYRKQQEVDVPFFNTKLLKEDTFAYDTGSAEGISTCLLYTSPSPRD